MARVEAELLEVKAAKAQVLRAIDHYRALRLRPESQGQARSMSGLQASEVPGLAGLAEQRVDARGQQSSTKGSDAGTRRCGGAGQPGCSGFTKVISFDYRAKLWQGALGWLAIFLFYLGSLYFCCFVWRLGAVLMCVLQSLCCLGLLMMCLGLAGVFLATDQEHLD